MLADDHMVPTGRFVAQKSGEPSTATGPGQSWESISLAMTFSEISRMLCTAPTVVDTLKRIVDFSVQAIEGCDGAAISFVTGDAIITPVWTEPTMVEVDTLQYKTGEGPCLDAIAQETMFCAEDLLSDRRWPTFGPQAAALGVRSVLSLRLLGKRTLGALNLYATLPRAYGLVDQAKGLIFTAHAGVALAAAGELERTGRNLAEKTKRLTCLERALRSQQVIGQAQGRLMQRERVTADQAYTLLRRASQHLNVKLREVADCVARTGEVPMHSDAKRRSA